jgi:hypothetical protein
VLAAAKRKYTAGYVDFLAVTDAQRSLYAARDQLVDIRRARLAALVTLFKALGGGWQQEVCPTRARMPAVEARLECSKESSSRSNHQMVSSNIKILAAIASAFTKPSQFRHRSVTGLRDIPRE